MRWPVFVAFALIFSALDSQLLAERFTIVLLASIHPTLVGVLLVFVALSAPRWTALWSAWGLGMLVDLAAPASPHGILLGPHALGYVFGAYVVLQLRTMVFRRRALTVGLVTLVCLSASGVVETALVTIHGWYTDDETVIRPLQALVTRFGIAVYSAVLALPVGWLLVNTAGIWGFQQSARRRSW